LGADAAERKVLGSAQFIVFAVVACKVFATTGAVLKKNYFCFKNVADCVNELFDIVVVFD
jgi:hypothetical protein